MNELSNNDESSKDSNENDSSKSEFSLPNEETQPPSNLQDSETIEVEAIEDKSKKKQTLSKFEVLKIKTFILYFRITNKLKRLKLTENFTLNILISIALISALIGMIIFGVFILKLSNSYTFLGHNIDLDASSKVGDFISGAVGAIWSLTGVFLFYATLQLQRKELAENRKHFQMSRLTDIVYRQVDFFNSQLENFTLIEIDDYRNEISHKNQAAINYLHRKREIALSEINLNHDKNNSFSRELLLDMFEFIELNKKSLLKIYSELNNHIDTIRAVLIKEGIPPIDLNELKAIFFNNIGKGFLDSSEYLLQLISLYLELKKKQGHRIDILSCPEHSIKIHLSNIIEFWRLKYDKKNTRDYLDNRPIYNRSGY